MWKVLLGDKRMEKEEKSLGNLEKERKGGGAWDLKGRALSYESAF